MNHLYWLLKLDDIRSLCGLLSIVCYTFMVICLIKVFLIKSNKIKIWFKIFLFSIMLFGLSFLTLSKLLPTTQEVLTIRQIENIHNGMNEMPEATTPSSRDSI